MAREKYNIYVCKDCEIDFTSRNAVVCCVCGDNVYLEIERSIWLDRPVIYKRPWTDFDKDMLIEMVERGISNKEIASELDRTKNAVKRQLAELRKKREIIRGIK